MTLRGIVTMAALILAIIAVSTTTAAALFCSGDICVNPSGWWRNSDTLNPSTTPIQAAVDNATAGETICVAAGSYTENVDIATPHLTLAGVVTVTAANAGDHVFEVTADYVNISGFTATGATAGYWPDAGLYLYGADHCNISENNCSYNGYGLNSYGIYLDSSSNNTLVSNTASNNSYGIWLNSSSNNTLTSNTASNNAYGIYLDSFYLYFSCDNDVTCNLVQNNTYCGIYLTIGSIGNNIAWNNIVANGELQTDGSYHYQFRNSQSDGVDAINNFWGTEMNNDTIDASIYDDEEGQAEVNFYPFETEPVPCAPAPVSEESSAFTTADAVIALRIAVGSCPLDLYWDVSGDGQVTSLDALMILGGTGTG